MTRQEILHRAHKLFLNNSNTNLVTMDNLATELKCSKKTVYKYFNTKDDLLNAMCDYEITKWNDAAEQVFFNNKSDVTRLNTIIYNVDKSISCFFKAPISQQFERKAVVVNAYQNLRQQSFEYYLKMAIQPYEDFLKKKKQSIEELAEFIITYLETIHQKEQPNQSGVETLIFLVFNKINDKNV
ncbi:MAG: TetR/AcrR family transcriptional regulator [Bacteroidota bacterium]